MSPVRADGAPWFLLFVVRITTTTTFKGAPELTEIASRRYMICNQDTAPCPIGSEPLGGMALSENKPQTFHPRSPLSWRSGQI